MLQEQLLDLWQRNEKTILFITHSIDEAVYMSERIVVMGARPGRIVEEIEVDLPRPRTATSAHCRGFGEIEVMPGNMLKKDNP